MEEWFEELHDSQFSGIWGKEGLILVGGGLGQILRSVDGGSSWTHHVLPLPSPVHAIAGKGDTIVATSDEGALLSTDGGLSWSVCSKDGPFRSVAFGNDRLALVGPNTAAVAATPQELNATRVKPWFEAVAFDGDRFLAVDLDSEKVLVLRDGRWQPLSRKSVCWEPRAIAAGGQEIIVGGANGVAFSTNGGKTWKLGAEEFVTDILTAACITPGGRWLLAGGSGDVIESKNRGRSWATTQVGDTVRALWADEGERVFAVGAGLYNIDSKGTVTTLELYDASEPPPRSTHARAFEKSGIPGSGRARVIWGPHENLLFLGGKTLKRSTDGGSTWSKCAIKLEQYEEINDINGTEDDLWLAATKNLYHSSDKGASWSKARKAKAERIFVRDDDVFCTGFRLLLRREPNGKWAKCGAVGGAVHQAWLNGLGELVVTSSKGIKISSDGGRTFNPVEFIDREPRPLFGFEEGFAITHAWGNYFVSHDHGHSWQRAGDSDGGLAMSPITIWGSAPDDLWAVDGEGVAHSSDEGMSWTKVPIVRRSLERVWGLDRERVWAYFEGLCELKTGEALAVRQCPVAKSRDDVLPLFYRDPRRTVHDLTPLDRVVKERLELLGAEIKRSKKREQTIESPHGEVCVPWAIQQLIHHLSWPTPCSSSFKHKRKHRSFSPLTEIQLGVTANLDGYRCLQEEPVIVIGRAKGGGQELYILAHMLQEPTNPMISCVGVGDVDDSCEYIDKLSDFLKKLK